MAKETAAKLNIDIFIVERPPRGDENKTYSELNLAANGLFPSLINPLKKVHYIPLPSLHKLPDKSRKSLFTGVVPVHLKPWGLKLLRNDIVTGVRSMFKDIKHEVNDDKENQMKDIKRKVQQEEKMKLSQQDGKTSSNQYKRTEQSDADYFQPPGRFGPSEEYGREKKHMDDKRHNQYDEHFQQDGGNYNWSRSNFKQDPTRHLDKERNDRFQRDGNDRIRQEQLIHLANERNHHFQRN